jgi:hypothetical protein
VADGAGDLDGQLQGLLVGRAFAAVVGDGDAARAGRVEERVPQAVDQHHLDVQVPQHRDVLEHVVEVVVRDNPGVDRDHEHMVAPQRHVAQDAPQVGWLDVLGHGEKAQAWGRSRQI